MGIKWFWGILILALVSLILSLFGPWSAKHHSSMMGDAVSDALKADGLDFASVDMSGNVARLVGNAPSEAAAKRAVEVAEGAKCEKCKNKKGSWHAVENKFDVMKLATASPYIFNATKGQDGSVLLDGYVQSEEDRMAVLAKAESLFPGRVTDNKVTLAAGAPNGAWGGVAVSGIAALQGLERGRLNMEDNSTVITGFAGDVETRDGVNAWASGLPGGYVGAANISVPEATAVNVGEIKSETVCQTLFNDLKGDNKINFEYDKAQIRGAESFDLLIRLASAGAQCGDFRIRVEGHTDADGSEKYNQWLSEARANEVVKFLVDNGVDITRMKAIGFGEAKPIADNSNPEGMARNRRIEFIVTRSE
mgnify:CR=1 FL=1